tara:strand:- start:5194 stop:5571 length:378 start_codon:yes stop_codon:yes gene_type:complete
MNNVLKHNNRLRKTIFLDVDGTLVKHKGNLHDMLTQEPIVINGTLEKLHEWRDQGYYIVITTARPKSNKNLLIEQLNAAGIVFDDIIIGLPSGRRVVINDKKPDMIHTAAGITLERDKGIGDLKI